MTNIEQDFFKAFEIEPIKYILPLSENSYWQDGSRIMQEADYKMFKIIENDLTEEDKKLVKFIYPEITDRKLLQMICIYNSTYTNGYKNYSLLNERNAEKLKEQILKNCLIVKDDIKQQIQQLFKEEE